MSTRSLESLLRPSGAHRWLHCHAAPYMEAQHADTQSYAAMEGTAAHALAESCLLEEYDAKDLIGGRLKAAPEITIDADMVRHVATYTEYVQGLKGQLFVEHQIDFPRLELLPNKGTADAIVVDWNMKHAHIVDLKYGQSPRNKVHAENNEQLYTYAVGVCRELEYLGDIDTFTLTIVQPRLDWLDHCTVTRDQLEEFEAKIVDAVEVALKVDESNVQSHLSPGKHCDKFCAAKAHCSAYAKYNVEAVAAEFEDLEIETLKEPGTLAPDELAGLLEHADAIKKWCDALQKRALKDLNDGLPVPGWKVVTGRAGNRAWIDEAAVLELLKKSRKISADQYAPRKLTTPPQLEKIVGHKLFQKRFENQLKRSAGKPTLAPESDTRSSVAVVDDFDDLDKGEDKT